MNSTILALDPLSALQLELAREVSPAEILEWFTDARAPRSEQCARILARCDVDRMIASLELTLVEKLDVQEAVYDRLEDLLDDVRLADVALAVLSASTSTTAHEILRRATAARARHIA